MQWNANVNGESLSLEIEPGDVLLDTLRRAGFFGVKRGCDEGTCGACLVVVNGRAVNSCVLYTARTEGARIMTVEGLGRPGALHPIQRAFLDAGAVQCGFCTPGIIMAAYALLQENPAPSEADIREGLAGNLCRCTGYVKYVEAIQNAAAEMRTGS